MPNRVDTMLSKGMGKAKARLKGLHGVFRTIAEQHGEVTALLERAKSSNEKFTELWPTIRRELMSHEKAEMREVFPALRAHPETRELADHHDLEAGDLETLILQIDALAVDAPNRKEMFQKLIDMVLDHAKEEENEIFPKAEKVLGRDTAEALDDQFLVAKEQVAEAV